MIFPSGAFCSILPLVCPHLGHNTVVLAATSSDVFLCGRNLCGSGLPVDYLEFAIEDALS